MSDNLSHSTEDYLREQRRKELADVPSIREADILLGRVDEKVEALRDRLAAHTEREDRDRRKAELAMTRVSEELGSLRRDVSLLLTLRTDMEELIEILRGMKVIKKTLLAFAAILGAVGAIAYFVKHPGQWFK